METNKKKTLKEWWAERTKKQKYIIIGCITFFVIASALNDNVKSKRSDSSSVSNCYGNESCISKVRENFSNTGKTILGEEYLGNGEFGISFMDSQHLGAAYNATVKTDCNCNVLDVNVSAIR